jgi:flagellar assembly factor FliW
MPLIETKYFGTMPYAAESVFEFPYGLPAFEQEHQFVFIEIAEYAPLVFLQSLNQPSLCFLALPVSSVDPEYRLEISSDDRAALQPEYRLEISSDDRAALQLEPQAPSGTEILALALLSMHDGFPATANLMAPIAVNVRTRRALQAIRMDQRYSHQHPVRCEDSSSICGGAC